MFAYCDQERFLDQLPDLEPCGFTTYPALRHSRIATCFTTNGKSRKIYMYILLSGRGRCFVNKDHKDVKCKAFGEGGDHDGLGRGAKEHSGWEMKLKGTRWQGC